MGVVGREPEETAQRQAVLAGGLAVHAGGGAELAGGVAGDAQGDCAKSRALRAAAQGERPGTAGVRVDPDRDRVAAGGMGVITQDRKSNRLNSSHSCATRMPSSA